ncbi:hypothetical protein [Dyadobacter sp. 3J3]|uniref:hypothetical protein n=1 Tax=Dyadobacter sp. 3J3 TaxID=2606600 RepID=UPI001357318D|nr:hypothetical protein [Dyadobacter sp. 3J3]
MKPNFKKILIAGGIVLISITCFVLYVQFKRQNQAPKQPIDIALDSADYWRKEVIKADNNLKDAQQNLKIHEGNIDSLAKDMATDSFAMVIRRSVLRARVKSDIRAGEIRDSIRRQHP